MRGGLGRRRTIHSPVPAAAEVRAVARTARGGRIPSASPAPPFAMASDATPSSSAGSFVSSTVTRAPGAAQPTPRRGRVPSGAPRWTRETSAA